MYIRRRHARRGMQLSGLGDTCWIDANTGAQVCGAGDPTGESNCTVSTPYYTPNGRQVAPDGTTWTWSRGGNTLFGTGQSADHKWTYNFLYHAGTSDVYQVSSGPKVTKFSNNYIQVSLSGTVTWLSSPPAQSELGCQNITTAVASGNTTAVVTSNPVYTGPTTPYYSSSMPAGYSAPAVQTPTPTKSGFSLSSIPTWALVAGAAGGGLLITKMMGKK
jgi:hypothetical protein